MSGYLKKTGSAAPLAVFRIFLGILLFVSVIRFWSNGWIEDLYIKPKYFFPFYGFDFVTPVGSYIYLLFGICALSAVLVALGMFYKVSIISLFLSFTYIELIDKSTYLNHYYFVSMVCLMMIFLPANIYFSVDAFRDRKLLADRIPAWCVDAIKLFVCIVYFYAGLAKINSDWLLHALPLKIWLPAKNDLPLIGELFNYPWIPYVFSWFGCLYDLSVPFLLLNRTTRLFGYISVVVFHLLTAILFPIGVFPYVMIVTALIFFSEDFHSKLINAVSNVFSITKDFLHPQKPFSYGIVTNNIVMIFFCVFFALQFLIPFRYMAYPGELFWTEEGYRFSWRVMLMEKAGYLQFTVKDKNGNQFVVNNNEFLTPLQEKMMSTQPDMILQYAHIVRDHYAGKGFQSPEVYADSYVALNGRMGAPLVDPSVDLAREKESFRHKSWITPFNDEIKGF